MPWFTCSSGLCTFWSGAVFVPLCRDALRIILCTSYQTERILVFKTIMATVTLASSVVCSVIDSLRGLYISCLASKDAASVSRTVSHCVDKPLGFVDEYVFLPRSN